MRGKGEGSDVRMEEARGDGEEEAEDSTSGVKCARCTKVSNSQVTSSGGSRGGLCCPWIGVLSYSPPSFA
jgi:hypothetical protein